MNTIIARRLIDILNHEASIRLNIKPELLDEFCFDESILMTGDEIDMPLKKMLGQDALSDKYDNDAIRLLVHASYFEREELDFNDADVMSACDDFDLSNGITLICMTEVESYDIRTLFLSDENGNLVLLYVHKDILK